MHPPYELNAGILELVTSISEMIGEVNANFLDKQSPQLRNQNKIKTIHSSLQIEGNALTVEQITALIENKKVIGPKWDILEVQNAIKVYNTVELFKSTSETSFLKAHKILMNGLIDSPGKYRTKGVGIVKGKKVTHVAPPAKLVSALMKDLFTGYLKKINSIIKFHHKFEIPGYRFLLSLLDQRK
jgi:Fic family protein